MQVTVPRPDVKGRTEILNWYLSKIKVDPGKSQNTLRKTKASIHTLVRIEGWCVVKLSIEHRGSLDRTLYLLFHSC